MTSSFLYCRGPRPRIPDNKGRPYVYNHTCITPPVIDTNHRLVHLPNTIWKCECGFHYVLVEKIGAERYFYWRFINSKKARRLAAKFESRHGGLQDPPLTA